MGERGKPLRPGAADNEATVPGPAPHDRGMAPPASPAGTRSAGRTSRRTCKEGWGSEVGEPWAPCCPAQDPARNPGDPLSCQASFPSQPRTQPAGQQQRRKRKSQGSEVTSRTQTRQSSLSHAQPRATRLNVRHRWSCSPCPGPVGPHAAGPARLPVPCTCPTRAAAPQPGRRSPACAPRHW